MFAGDEARLTAAMQAIGVQVAVPQDLATGGLDLSDPAQVGLLLGQLRSWRQAGYRLIVHMAPPCSTFSRVRHRKLPGGGGPRLLRGREDPICPHSLTVAFKKLSKCK